MAECIFFAAGNGTGLFSTDWWMNETFWIEIFQFLGRVIGTCAVFYIFFLCRMLGAGDIKLMAVIVGNAGIQGGCEILFLGMMLALLVFCIQERVWKYGFLRMKNRELRLAPYLFAGFCLYMICSRCGQYIGT